MIFDREPAVIYGLVNSIIALVCAFGLNLSAEQTGGIMAVTSAVLALITRESVYSPATVEAMTAPDDEDE